MGSLSYYLMVGEERVVLDFLVYQLLLVISETGLMKIYLLNLTKLLAFMGDEKMRGLITLRQIN